MLLCRAEQQRNEVLLNAEELTRAFKKFKEKATEKLEQVRDFSLFLPCRQQTAVDSPVGQLFLLVGGKVLRELGQGKQLG